MDVTSDRVHLCQQQGWCLPTTLCSCYVGHKGSSCVSAVCSWASANMATTPMAFGCAVNRRCGAFLMWPPRARCAHLHAPASLTQGPSSTTALLPPSCPHCSGSPHQHMPCSYKLHASTKQGMGNGVAVTETRVSRLAREHGVGAWCGCRSRATWGGCRRCWPLWLG